VVTAIAAKKTMKAIVQDGYGSADVLRLQEIDKPVVADDGVLVRVRAASVNALDWHTVHGGRAVRMIGTLMRQSFDPVRGADLAGEVEVVGKDVTGLRPGDEVFGTGRGTFAEYAIASEKSLVPKPHQLTFAEASAMGVAAKANAMAGTKTIWLMRTPTPGTSTSIARTVFPSSLTRM